MNAPVRTTNWHDLDRDFLQRVRSASLAELRTMRRMYEFAQDWKRIAIERRLISLAAQARR